VYQTLDGEQEMMDAKRRYGAIVLGVLAISLILSACNLGREEVPETVPPVEPIPGNDLDVTPSLTPIPPADDGGGGSTDGGEESNPPQSTDPTVTPTPLPSEILGPIAIEGTDHRTAEPVTVTVTRGKSVSTVTCTWNLQDSGQSGALGTATTEDVDENTFKDTYTFTPDAAGTYQVNCTGVATTQGGQRAVSAQGTPFAVEAKG
jgi:hypothetical protein